MSSGKAASGGGGGAGRAPASGGGASASAVSGGGASASAVSGGGASAVSGGAGGPPLTDIEKIFYNKLTATNTRLLKNTSPEYKLLDYLLSRRFGGPIIAEFNHLLQKLSGIANKNHDFIPHVQTIMKAAFKFNQADVNEILTKIIPYDDYRYYAYAYSLYMADKITNELAEEQRLYPDWYYYYYITIFIYRHITDNETTAKKFIELIHTNPAYRDVVEYAAPHNDNYIGDIVIDDTDYNTTATTISRAHDQILRTLGIYDDTMKYAPTTEVDDILNYLNSLLIQRKGYSDNGKFSYGLTKGGGRTKKRKYRSASKKPKSQNKSRKSRKSQKTRSRRHR